MIDSVRKQGGDRDYAFDVEVRHAPPSDLVRPFVPSPSRRAARLCYPDTPALVLGSTQDDALVDHERCAAAGLGVVRRTSGGSAVVVVPDGQVWLDVFVPFDDPLAEIDVTRAPLWLGNIWKECLQGSLPEESILNVHRAAMERGPYSELACFLGIGSGEVLVDHQKVVGISQRRTRAGTQLFSMAFVRFGRSDFVELFVDTAGSSRSAFQSALEKHVVSLEELNMAPQLLEDRLRSALS